MNYDVSSRTGEAVAEGRDPEAALTLFAAYRYQSLLGVASMAICILAWVAGAIIDGDLPTWVGVIAAFMWLCVAALVAQASAGNRKPPPVQLADLETVEDRLRKSPGHRLQLRPVYVFLSLSGAFVLVLGIVRRTGEGVASFADLGSDIFLASVLSHLLIEHVVESRFLRALDALGTPNRESPPGADAGRALEA